MFNSPDFPASLEEETFNEWLEKGRESRIGYHYLLIVWDVYESSYKPLYAEHRDELEGYPKDRSLATREWLVAAYDLYSESRIL